MTKRTINLCFLVLGLGILLFLLSKVNVDELVGILRNADPTFVSLGILLSLMQPILTTMKWHLLLKNKNIRIPFHHLLASHMIGSFVSSFFPSRYSGDVYRTYVVAKYSGKTYDSAASVALHRLSGLFVMGFLGLSASVFGLYLLDQQALTVAIMMTSVAILGGSTIVFSQKVFQGFDTVLRAIRLNFARGPAAQFHAAIMDYRHETKLILKILFLSLLFYLEAFIIVFTAALAIGAKVPFIYVMLVVPMIYLLEALPISINGLGIREGAFVFFFMRVGLQFEQALAIAVVVLFFRLIKSVSGGCLFLGRYMDFSELPGSKERILTASRSVEKVEGERVS